MIILVLLSSVALVLVFMIIVVMIRSALFVTMEVGVRVWIISSGNLFLVLLDFLAKSCNISPQNHLLGTGQQPKGRLYVIRHYGGHDEEF